MYTVYSSGRSNNEGTFKTSDLRTAYIVAYNNVCFLGYNVAYVTDSETGEILKIYEHR